jgi:O-antigen/teichoic acid export membrane protein
VEIGTSALLILVVQTVAAATDLNLNVGLPRLLPQLGDRRARVVATSYLTLAVLGGSGGAFVVLLSPRLSAELREVMADWRVATAVIIAVALWGVFALQDNILIAVRRAGWAPVSNVAYGAAKVALVVMLGAANVPGGVLFAWVLPLPLIVLCVTLGPVRSGIRDYRGGAKLCLEAGTPTRAALASFIAFDYAAMLLQQISVVLMPLVVLLRLGAVSNAWFSVAFIAVAAAEAVIVATANALTSEAAAEPHRAMELARPTILRLAVMLSISVLIGWLAVPPVLRLFGSSYATHASPVLRAMLVAALPLAVLILRAALWRIQGRARPIFITHAAVLALLAAFVVPAADRWEVVGVAWAWCAAMAIPASFLLPALVRAAQKHSASEGRPT